MEDVNAVETLPAGRMPVAAAPSFASVVEQHLDDVYRYLLVLTRDPTLAEDLASETFERALRAWRRFDPRRGSARTHATRRSTRFEPTAAAVGARRPWRNRKVRWNSPISACRRRSSARS